MADGLQGMDFALDSRFVAGLRALRETTRGVRREMAFVTVPKLPEVIREMTWISPLPGCENIKSSGQKVVSQSTFELNIRPKFGKFPDSCWHSALTFRLKMRVDT
jgi:hypothetical protein